jgi:hypothetical protein
MAYAPRNEQEIAIVLELLAAFLRNARGQVGARAEMTAGGSPVGVAFLGYGLLQEPQLRHEVLVGLGPDASAGIGWPPSLRQMR